MNPMVDAAYRAAPKLRKWEKLGRYLLIVAVIGIFLYMSKDEMSKINKKMDKYFGEDNMDDDWESEENDSSWIINMYATIFKDNFSMRALKDMGFYIGLTVFSIVGFGILNHLNVKRELKIQEIQEKAEQEAKQNEGNKNKSENQKENEIKTQPNNYNKKND